MRDLFNREIDYLRISITDQCNYNCRYCNPSNRATIDETIQMNDDELITLVEAASQVGIKKVRLTGGEPLMRTGIISLIAKMKSIKGINEIALTSNGSLLPNHLHALKKAGLDRVNISLDTLDPKKFSYITKGGSLKNVLSSIKRLIELEMTPIKLNVVLMKGINDHEIEDFVQLTKEQDVIVRFIELMPIGTQDFSFKKHYMSNEHVLKQCPNLYKIGRTKAETATYFKLPNALGKVGLISPVSHHFCSTCNRIRVTSDGMIKPCLHSQREYNLLNYMRAGNHAIDDYLKECITNKPHSHNINEKEFKKVVKSMSQIGG